MAQIGKTTAVILATLGMPALAAGPPADRRNFVTCPIVQDTKTVPCWVADYNGERYYLGIQGSFGSAFWPPFLDHKVIVEGTATDKERICGGIVLDPVKVASLPERDDTCNTILPIDARYEIPFHHRGPGPNELEEPAARPPAAARPVADTPAVKEVKPPRVFKVLYDFNNRGWSARNSPPIRQAIDYYRSMDAAEIEVVGYRGGSLLSDGTSFIENEGVSELRAKQVELILKQVGIPEDKLTIRWETEPRDLNGTDDWNTRSADITVKPQVSRELALRSTND